MFYNLSAESISSSIGIGIPMVLSFFMLVTLWTLFWKGLALWHSAKRGEPWWFIALLLVNTVGVLEIVYLFFFAKLKGSDLFSASPSGTETESSGSGSAHFSGETK